MKLVLIIPLLIAFCAFGQSSAINILTWEGYITAADVENIDNLLKERGYSYHVNVIQPYASDAEQMYSLIRSDQVDIAFLTLYFIKMGHERLAKFILPVDVTSPRLTNYQKLYPELTTIEMGMRHDKPLYIPFAGGVYGFWQRSLESDTKNIVGINELWDKKLAGKLSLNSSQPWYNVGLALMSLGKEPFYLNTLLERNRRAEAKEYAEYILLPKLAALYDNAGELWEVSPKFEQPLNVVSSWGPEVIQHNKNHQDWQKINFAEGDIVWLDTINFLNHLTGRKLEASEIIANYFIGQQVQDRVAQELFLFPANKESSELSLLPLTIDSFQSDMFVPPFNFIADNLVKSVTAKAIAKSAPKRHPLN